MKRAFCDLVGTVSVAVTVHAFCEWLGFWQGMVAGMVCLLAYSVATLFTAFQGSDR